MKPSVPDAAALMDVLQRTAPDRRVDRLRREGSVDESLIALSDEAERLAVVEVGRALEATGLVVTLADAAGPRAAQARARRARAKALAYAGRFEEALSFWQAAVELAEQVGQPVEAARSRMASMQALGELGRFDEAIAEGKAARSAFLRANKPVLAARANANLGTVYQRRGDPAQALVHFERARSALSREPITAGQLDSNRGEALLALNDFAGAEKAFLDALKTFETNNVGWGTAIVEGNLADLATRQGRLERALYYFERARRHLESDASPGHLARLLAEQADAMAVLGLLEDALVGYRSALDELDRCGLALEAARAQAGLGTVLLRLARLADAEAALAAAAGAFDKLGHAAARARVDVIRGELAAADGRAEEAHTLIVGALSALQNQPLESAIARYHLARLALDTGDPATAEAELDAALPTAQQLDVAPLAADLLHMRGLARREQGKLHDASRDLQAAVEQVERVRGSLQAARFRAAYLTNRLAMYQDLVTTVLDGRGQGHLAAAFLAAERAKSRSLLDVVSGAIDPIHSTERQPGDPAEAEIMDELVRLRSEVNGLYSQLSAPGHVDEPHRVTDQWRKALRQRERHLEGLESRLSTTQGVAGLYAPPVDLATAQMLVPPGAAMIEYFTAGDELLAFVLRRDGAAVFRALGKTADLAEGVRRFRFQIGRAARPGAMDGSRGPRLVADALQVLKGLHAMVIGPLGEDVAETERLIIVPHGPLHLVPFAALWDGRQHLIEAHEIHTVPSASLLAHIARGERRRDASGSAVVVGVGDDAAPRIVAEAEEVAAILGCDQLLLGDDATADRVSAAIQRAAVIHLACHGRFSVEAALGSGLKLADRWLTVRDIYPMRLQADLVVLSGCETGRNLVTAGDELVGLLRGFFAAGARSLLASLWRVNDESTSEFMSVFYGLWNRETRQGTSHVAALREAQRQLLAKRPHPAFWSPFILVGRP